METAIEKRLIDLYLSNVDIIDEGLPTSMTHPRSAALEIVNLSGLPVKGSGNGDRYHYTSIAELFKGETEHYFTPSYTSAHTPQTEPDEYCINILNGFCHDREMLTTLDNGAVFGSLAAAANTDGVPFAEYYNTMAGQSQDTTAALNTVFAQDGAFIYIPRGVSLAYPVRIRIYGYSENEEAVAVFPRLLIIAGENSKGQMIIEHATLSGSSFLSCVLTETFIAEGASVEVAEVTEINPQSSLIVNNFASQQASSKLGSLNVVLSGQVVRGNINVSLLGSGAENHTNGLSISGAGEHFDFSTSIEHIAPDCTSYEHFKAIAADGGTGVFSGRIFVAQDAQRTQAYQKNNNLLLSDNASIYTKPQLEIFADNVKCSHGATIGQLDQDAVYYMRQRGIDIKDARRLQMYGFVNEIFNLCRVENICGRLEKAASDKIESL